MITLLLLAHFCAQTPSSSPLEILQEVKSLIEQEKISAARERLVRALRQYPQESNLHNFLGVVEARQGDRRSAESSFLRAIDRAPQSPSAYLNLGRLYQENAAGEPDALEKALATYWKLLKYRPEDVEANYQSAVLLLNKGEFRASLRHLERLPEEARRRPQAIALACAGYAGLSDIPRAKDAAAILLESPDLTDADVLPIFAALEAGARDDLDDLFLFLLEGLDRRRLASAVTLRKLAGLYERRAKLAGARETLERVAAAGGISSELLVELGRVAYKQGDHKGALGYLAHARDLDPENPAIHFFFGMVCVEIGLGSEAHESLARAVQLRPEDAYYNYAMGAVSLQRKDPGEAIPYFAKYCELKPADPRGRLALGIAYFESADFGSARKVLREVVAHRETAPGGYYYLARLAREEGDIPEALRAAEKAIEANPAYADAHAEMGLLRFRQREYELAEEALKRSLEIDPDHYQANFTLLMLFRRLRDPRGESQAGRFEEVKNKRSQKAQDFLRTIEVRPYGP